MAALVPGRVEEQTFAGAGLLERHRIVAILGRTEFDAAENAGAVQDEVAQAVVGNRGEVQRRRDAPLPRLVTGRHSGKIVVAMGLCRLYVDRGTMVTGRGRGRDPIATSGSPTQQYTTKGAAAKATAGGERSPRSVMLHNLSQDPLEPKNLFAGSHQSLSLRERNACCAGEKATYASPILANSPQRVNSWNRRSPRSKTCRKH